MAISVNADVPIITQVKTMAELILTLTAGAGTVITQPTIVNPIISEFGSADYQMQNLVNNGAFNLYDKTTGEVLNISTEDAIDHIGDLDWLQDNNAEFKMDYQNFSNKVSASNTLAKTGANLIHQAALQTGNPMEWDWGELIETYLNQGKLSYELLFTDYNTGNTIIEDMAGILNNIVSFWTPNIKNDLPLDAVLNQTALSHYDNVITIDNTNAGYKWYNIYYPSDVVSIVEPHAVSNNRTEHYVYLVNTSTIKLYYAYGENAKYTSGIDKRNYVRNTYTRDYYDFNGADFYVNEGEATSLITSILNNEVSVPEKYSSNLINPILGNLSAEDLQNVSPSIENGQAIIPFDQSAYQDLMNDLNNNTNNNVPENNPSLVSPFIQDYIVNNEQVDPEPDTPTNPIPDQPTIPDKEPITDEEKEENLTGTTSGLEEIFPFCIPFDIVKLIKGLRAERKAPVIDWTFESDLFGFSYTFHIDLAEFNDVASILRTMELIVFIIGLAVATRKLIGAGG